MEEVDDYSNFYDADWCGFGFISLFYDTDSDEFHIVWYGFGWIPYSIYDSDSDEIQILWYGFGRIPAYLNDTNLDEFQYI